MKNDYLSNTTGKPLYKDTLREYLPFAFICLVALALFVRHLLCFDRGLDFIVSRVTVDDTYYYLNTAWNQRHLGFTTFDGINPTNGVQFLWYWLLVGFSYLFETREAFLSGTLVLCAVLGTLAIFAAYRLGQVLGLGWKSIVPAMAIAGLAGYNKTLIVGLENTLHLLLILLLVIEYCRFLQKLNDPKYSSRRYFRITCLLALITWARLDNAPISAILFIHATFEFWRANRQNPRFYWRKIVVSSALIVLSALIMFYGYYAMGGSYIPVSGLWKNRPEEETRLVPVFVDAWQNAFQRIFPLEHVLSKLMREGISVILPICFLITLIVKYRSATNEKPLLRGLLVLLAGIAFHEMIMVFRLPEDAVGRGFWYQGPQFVMLTVIVSLLIHWLPAMPNFRMARIHFKPAMAVAVIFVLNILVFTAYTNNWYLRHKSYDDFHSKRVEAARWLNTNLPAGVRFGALNSGELGFFSHRPVTNLDGLINSYSYFKFRKNGGGIRKFCEMQGIDYFIDYAIPEDMKENSKPVFIFESKPTLQLIKLLKPNADVSASVGGGK